MKKILNKIVKIITIVLIVIVTNYVCKISDIYLFVDQKVIPVMVGIIGAVASIFSLLKPIISKLDLSNINLDDSLAKNKKLIEENLNLKVSLNSSLENIEKLEKDLKVLIDMVKLGFASNETLVKNGTANIICKKGDIDEK